MNALPGRSSEPSPAAGPAKPARIALPVAIATVLILAGLLAGYLPRWRERAAVGAETRELAVPTVAVVSPAPGQTGPQVSLPAEIRPWVEAPIYARASGYLERWYVDLGARVEAGQLLAEIETPELSRELDGARAQLAQAEAARTLARTTAERWATAARTASVSEQETAEKKADLALKSAAVQAAAANVRRLEELLSFARVTAPFAGTITERNTDVGDLIVAGSGKELFRLAETRKLRVYVQVPQATARSVAPGQPAELLIPEIPGRPFAAKVVRSAGAMSADSRTLLVELEVENPGEEILAGGFAQVRFRQVNPHAPLTLPSSTLLFRPDGPQVGVVDPSGTVELRNVTLGRDFGPTIEIASGVSPENRVILNPPDSLVNGAKVRIAEATEGKKGQ